MTTAVYDRIPPPPLQHALVRGTTWRLNCRDCEREVAVDVIGLVEGVADIRDFDSRSTFARARCRECGGRMKMTGGIQVDAMKNTGWMPRLIVGDGSDWRRPDWRAAPSERLPGEAL